MPRAPWPNCCLLLQLLFKVLFLMLAATCSTTTFFSPPPPLVECCLSNNTSVKQHLHNVNPWLTSADLRAVAHVPEPRCPAAACPPPCKRQQAAEAAAPDSNNMTQCLYYLQESHKEEVCGGREADPQRRRAQLHQLRMRHCCEHAVDEALPEEAFGGGPVCRDLLEALLQVDDIASRLSCGHAEMLTRYDCAQNFSIAHDCKDCKEAYRRWVCSSLVPHYTRSGERMRPCRSVCEDVEQQCPYLLPDQTIQAGEAAHPTPQYAGEPTFLCLDPNIPEAGQQKLKSSYGDEDCCYTHCGRGRGSEQKISGSGQPDGQNYILGICEHCPGRPPQGASLTGGARTFNQVSSLLWTMALLITLLQTEDVFKALLRCFLYSVRTFYRRFFKDRTHS